MYYPIVKVYTSCKKVLYMWWALPSENRGTQFASGFFLDLFLPGCMYYLVMTHGKTVYVRSEKAGKLHFGSLSS